MSSTNDFDNFADSYRAEMARSIHFCGREHVYFTRRKVEELVDLARRRLGDPAALTMLDVGCGVGASDELLARHVGALHGVDPAAKAIERATVANPTVKYKSYDGKTLPYDDASVDLAFAICVMHHVDVAHRQQFTSELRRVVRPGGLVVIFEHNPYNPLTQRGVRNCGFDQGVVLLSRRKVRRLLTGAGLEPVEARFVIFSPYDKRWVPGLERRIGWLPAGAQHYVAARR